MLKKKTLKMKTERLFGCLHIDLLLIKGLSRRKRKMIQ